ncbi:hypothetical protein SETIT_5G083300v2 [Setaria italica]|uniref:SIAH-type domain-containing protein n=2 Tax=Setaria italica TaxID=4555 RepID=A0A368R2L5_SETIT|nr:E3 ubiquitin-protein ligase SINA-like 7 [Setaria italica]RCV24429.1 hypothetical protein SETIT_5G083300v2 [Setaria italica]
MGSKRPRQVLITGCGRKGPAVFAPRGQAETAAATSQHRAEKITVTLDADLLQCCVCSGPLTTPLFQCTKGHISCSDCCTDVALDDESECLMCREPETATRCRAMERVLAGLSVPCAFRQHGCAEMIPYGGKQAHEASCRYAPCHCPIPGCAGYAGKSLAVHVGVDHPDVHRTRVRPDCLTPLRMRAFEQARVVLLGHGCAEFLLVVGMDVPSGRSLSLVGLMDEQFDEFKYRIEVVGKDGVLALFGQAARVDRLARPYHASAFLFVPNAIWDSYPEDIPVFIHLK